MTSRLWVPNTVTSGYSFLDCDSFGHAARTAHWSLFLTSLVNPYFGCRALALWMDQRGSNKLRTELWSLVRWVLGFNDQAGTYSMPIRLLPVLSSCRVAGLAGYTGFPRSTTGMVRRHQRCAGFLGWNPGQTPHSWFHSSADPLDGLHRESGLFRSGPGT